MSGPVYLHETDSQGFPLCLCPACRAQSKIINDKTFARMFRGIFKPGHDEQQEHEERSQDYSEGMK